MRKPVLCPGRGKAARIAALILAGAAGVVLLADTVRTSNPLVGAFPKHLLFMCLAYATLAVSLNFVTGYVGQVSMGHAAFFGLGGYASALATKVFRVPFWVAFLLAGLVAGFMAIPLGLPSVRVKGPFLVVVTYGFGEILRFTAINLRITGGPAGMPGLESPSIFIPFSDIGTSGKEAFIIVAAILLAVATAFSLRVKNSRLGLAFTAVRDDEVASGAMGINPNYYKILALAMAGVFAGLTGSLYVHYTSYISPDIFNSAESILILAMVVVGGTSTVFGPVFGAFALTLLPQFLKWAKDVLGLRTDPWTMLFGLMLILLMRYKPEGFQHTK